VFLNVVPFRTHLDGCTSFRDIVTRAMETFIDAITHELPVNVIEQAFPDFIKAREDVRTSQFIISSSVSLFDDDLTYPIAEGAREISERLLQEPVHHDIPSGIVWNLSVEPAGKLNGSVLFNQDEFDESIVQGWAADLRHILTSAVRHPDQDWKNALTRSPSGSEGQAAVVAALYILGRGMAASSKQRSSRGQLPPQPGLGGHALGGGPRDG
jgi:non-ribosomal peptide synthetase component F